MGEPAFKFVTANDIRFRVAEMGNGPLVLLLHGWPESWYSWRHQLRALAGAGYRAAAPDMRGYGQTDKPDAVEAYDMHHLMADVIGLVEALGAERCHLVGHDWGSIIAWPTAICHPERFLSLTAMSVPYTGRPEASLTDILKAQHGDNFNYILYHQQPSVAEAEYDADVRGFLKRQYISPDTPRNRPTHTDPKAGNTGWIPRLGEPMELPQWLTPADLDYFVSEFEQSGFRGGINYYRNFHRNWETMPELAHLKCSVPTLFVSGAKDPVIRGADSEKLKRIMADAVPGLKDVILYPGAGHWIQQERADEVNRALIEFIGKHDGED